MKKRLKLFSILFFMMITSGCWSNHDLADLSLVVGIAIDKTDTGEFELTVQIVKPGAIKPSGDTSGKNDAYVDVSASGESMFDASKNLLALVNRRLYYAHVQLYILSEEIAKSGISEVFDVIERRADSRRRTLVLISRGIKAKTLLGSKSKLESIPATHITEELEVSDTTSESFKIEMIRILEEAVNKGNDIVLPVLYNSTSSSNPTQEDFPLRGAAVFKKDKLAGYLDPIQTMGYSFASGKVKSADLEIPNPMEKGRKVAIEVTHMESRLIAEIKNGQPYLGVKVAAKGEITEQHGGGDLTDDYVISTLETEAEKEIAGRIQDMLRIVQKEYHSDILGFNDKLYKNHHREWEKMVDHWEDIYSRTPINVNVEFEMRKSGMVRKPAAIK